MKKSKVIILMGIVFLILIIISNTTFATIDPNNFKPSEINVGEVKPMVELGQKIIGVITIVGIIISFVAIMVLGIKYMVGSTEAKAEYKKTMFPMLIGFMLLFGISWIVRIIYDVVSKM